MFCMFNSASKDIALPPSLPGGLALAFFRPNFKKPRNLYGRMSGNFAIGFFVLHI